MPFVQVTPTDDVYISQFFPNKNFGKLTTLLTGKYLQSNDAYRSLLKFDLAGAVPPGSIILDAVLKLLVYRKDKTNTQLLPQTVNVYANASNFSQSTVTWNNAPELNPTRYSINIEDSDVNNFISIDITSIVISWFHNIVPNNGITLVGMDNIVDSIIGYRSTEWTIPEQRPLLNIQYEHGTSKSVDYASAHGKADNIDNAKDTHPDRITVVTETTGPTKAIIPAGTLSNTYAYIYNAASETVPDGVDVIFDSNGVMIGDLSHTENTASIYISSAGDYKIEFLTTSTTNSQFAIMINGTTIIPGSVYGVSLLSALGFAHQSQGQVIITVPDEGSIITLRNVSGSYVTLDSNNGGTSNDCNASIMITRLN
jgi:hypothetical protein